MEIHKCGIMFLCKLTKVYLWNCSFVELYISIFILSIHAFVRLCIEVFICGLISAFVCCVFMFRCIYVFMEINKRGFMGLWLCAFMRLCKITFVIINPIYHLRLCLHVPLHPFSRFGWAVCSI